MSFKYINNFIYTHSNAIPTFKWTFLTTTLAFAAYYERKFDHVDNKTKEYYIDHHKKKVI